MELLVFQEDRLQAKLREEQERNNALLEKQERQIRRANSLKESKEAEQATVSRNIKHRLISLYKNLFA